ncbi:hypothetical protein G9A89_013373 [Geosiphon pyriformis]|nr:hypothetical protein G9A89_013373 [Geosiphon pyriformis]
METNAHDIWNYVALVGEKTCVIDCYLVSYAQARCATVCFDSAKSLDAVIKTTPVLKEVNLCWFCLVLAKCTGCKKLGHTSLACLINRKKNVSSGASLQKTLLDLDKTQIASGSSFPSPPGWNILLKAGSSLKIKPISLVFLELNDRFAALKHSFASLAERVDMLAKRLDTLEPIVFQLSPGHQPLVTLLSQNQEMNIVMSESLGVVTGGF